MKTISIRNFKSYQKQIVHMLNNQINVFLGSNGHGKSNFFKAISFLLCDKISLNRNEYQNNLHKAIDVAQDDIEIQIVLHSVQKNIDDQIYKLSRSWKNDSTEEYRINQKKQSKSEFEAFIQGLGLSYTNPYNIIQQGKITQITLMDQHQLYQLLQEATGIKKFFKRQQEAKQNLQKTKKHKQQINQQLGQLESKIKIIDHRRQEFQFYAMEEKNRKWKSKKIYQQFLQTNLNQINIIKKQLYDNSVKLRNLNEKLIQDQEEVNSVNCILRITQEKKVYYSSQEQVLSQVQQSSQYKKQLNEDSNKIKKFDKKIIENQQKILSKKKQLQMQKSKLQIHQHKYQSLNNDYQIEQNIDKKEILKQNMKNEIRQQIDISKQIQLQLKKVIKIKGGISPINSLKIQQQKQEIKTKIEFSRKSLQLNKIDIIQNNRIKNSLQSQIETIQNKKMFTQHKIRKFAPLIDINQLKSLHQIQGVYGFMMELIYIHPDVQFAYEIAGFSKLCTLIVEDQTTVTKVIAHNKKNKGKQINILPLSHIKKIPFQKKIYPKLNDVHSLINQDWIKINEDIDKNSQFYQELKKIINNTFNKYLLVRNYESALQMSKEYHLNCITADREIVYSQAYLCRVGRQQATQIETKIGLVQKYMQLLKYEKHKSQNLDKVIRKLTELQNEQIQIMRLLQQLQLHQQNIKNKFHQMVQKNQTIQRLQNQQNRLQQIKKSCQMKIQQKKKQIQIIQSKKIIKIDLEEMKKVQKQFMGSKSKVEFLLRDIYSMESQKQKLNQEKYSLQNEVEQLQEKISILVNHNIKNKLIPAAQILLQLNEQQNKLKEKRSLLQEQLQNISIQIQKFQLFKQQNNDKKSFLQLQQHNIKIKLQEIGQIEVNSQEMEEISNSMSVSMLSRKQYHHFTVKDRLFFAKFSNIMEKYQSYRLDYTELENVEKNIIQLINKFMKEVEIHMDNMIKNFQTHFTHVFQRLVLDGVADVRVKKVTEKVRGNIKYKNCLSIRVSFDRAQSAPKKWNEFSGGQKTVVAICLLMALQKCQPAPFYIFDEIDSALDKYYVQRILELIKEQSQHSQYFISTFKSEMMNFSEKQCNYYVVDLQNRVSNISRVNKAAAIDYAHNLVQ